MNILISPDVRGWAIGNLVDSIVKHQKHRFNFILNPIHPRGVAEDTAWLHDQLKNKGLRIDLWHAHYWHSAEQAIEITPELRNIPTMLTAHNHYQINKPNYDLYGAVTIATKWGAEKLSGKGLKVNLIPYGIDLDKFTFVEDLPEKKNIGYIGRVIEHKNLHKITRAAKKLGYRVVGSGFIDKPQYWDKVKDRDVLDFIGGLGRGSAPLASKKNRIYEKMTIYCQYSTGEKETGTLPLLEAMARGVPVLTTEQGMARDLIIDGENGIFFDENNFEERLDMLMKDEQLREKIRQKAWDTIKNYSEQRYARETAKSYFKMLYPDQHLISVIIPTFERPEQLIESIIAIEAQDYRAKEIIVVDDNSSGHGTKTAIRTLKDRIVTPLVYLNTKRDGYNLAMARNIGAVEALGEQLVFLDDRLKLEDGALGKIAGYNNKEKVWYWGAKLVKGKISTKKAFVENFSWVNKKDFIKFGMFNERINCYGAMSQEVRQRGRAQGILFDYCPEAKASQMIKSSKVNKHKDIWKAKYLLSKMYD